MPAFNQNYFSNLDFDEEISKIKIENNTSESLTFWFDGPESKKVSIRENGSSIVKLQNGDYRILAQTSQGQNYIASQSISGIYYSSYQNNRISKSTRDYPSSSNPSRPSYPTSQPVYRSPQSNIQTYSNPSVNSYKRRIGAICNDGWRSSATGRGACSHHGGVKHWLYE